MKLKSKILLKIIAPAIIVGLILPGLAFPLFVQAQEASSQPSVFTQQKSPRKEIPPELKEQVQEAEKQQESTIRQQEIERLKNQIQAIKDKCDKQFGNAKLFNAAYDKCIKETEVLKSQLKNLESFQNAESGKAESCSWWDVGCHILSKLTSILNRGLAWILNAFLRIAGVLMQVAAYLFDEILTMNLNPSTFDPSSGVYGGGFVYDGWIKLRDLANLIFIFFLLAIAIATILGWETYGIKKALLTLVIMAVLINFSLMFSRYIIELPNTLAEYLYKNNVEKIGEDLNTASASALILHGLNPQQIYNTAKEIGEGGDIAVTGKIIVGTILGIIVVLGIAMAFFSAAVLLIMRVVMLWFLMILSPIAFLMYAFPATSSYGRTWLNWLFNQAFFLPVLVFFLYIGINFASKINASPKFSEIQAFNPERPETFITFSLKYLLVLFMFSIAVWLAKSMAGKSGEAMLSWGDKAKGLALGVVGAGLGYGLGKAGKKLEDVGYEATGEKKTGKGAAVARGFMAFGRGASTAWRMAKSAATGKYEKTDEEKEVEKAQKQIRTATTQTLIKDLTEKSEYQGVRRIKMKGLAERWKAGRLTAEEKQKLPLELFKKRENIKIVLPKMKMQDVNDIANHPDSGVLVEFSNSLKEFGKTADELATAVEKLGNIDFANEIRGAGRGAIDTLLT